MAAKLSSAQGGPHLAGALRFVGRRQELAALSERVREAAAGRASLNIVSGPEGIGKTRLVYEALRDQTVRPTWLLCSEIESGLRAAFDQLARRRDVRATARRAAEPVVVVLENLHAVAATDRVALDRLLDIATGVARAKLAVICTFRDDPMTEVAKADFAAQVLSRAHHHLRLQPLTAVEIDVALVPHAFDQHTIGELARLCDGNPRYLEQLVGSIAEFGNVRIPDGVETSTTARLLSVGEDARDVAYAASVLGREFGVRELSHLAIRSSLPRQLQRLSDAGIIEPIAPGRYRFRQELVREAIYRRIVPENARRLHAEAARFIARSPKRRESAVVLAQHCERAQWARRAYALYRIAADAAERRHDDEAAAAAFSSARRQPFLNPSVAAALAEAHARVLSSAGRLDETIDALSDAIAFVSELEDPERLIVRIRERAIILTRAGKRRTALQELERSLAKLTHLGPDVTAPLMRVGAVLATLGGAAFRPELEKWQSRVGKLSPGTDPHERADAPMVSGVQALFEGDWPGAMRSFSAAIKMARDRDYPETDFHVTMSVGHHQRFGGLVSEALGSYRHAYLIAQRERNRWMLHYAGSHLARLLILTGALNEARDIVELNISLSPLSQTTRVATAGNAVLVGALLRERSLVEAFLDTRYVEMAIDSESSGALGDLAFAFATGMRARGEVDRARALVARVLPHLEQPWEARPFLAMAPLWGGPEAAPAAQSLLQSRAATTVPGAGPFRDLCEAYTAFPKRPAVARHRGERAAAGFRRSRLFLLAAAAEEVARHRRAALAVYRSIGDAYDASRLAGRNESGDRLTIRQRQILELVGSGHTNKAIAERLGLSTGTVSVHLHVVYRRLQVSSRAQAVAAIARQNRT